MVRELLSKLSGNQITMIILTLILVPGAVGAAVTFQPAVIVDPSTGRQSYVDNGRRLYVFDPIAGYRNNPANIFFIGLRNTGNACDGSFTVPAGKALVLTSITGHEYYNNQLSSGFTIIDGAACSGYILTTHQSSVSVTTPSAPVAVNFGSGIVVKAGRTVSISSHFNRGYTFLHGYLIPAGAAPAAAIVQDSETPKRLTTEDIGTKP